MYKITKSELLEKDLKEICDFFKKNSNGFRIIKYNKWGGLAVQGKFPHGFDSAHTPGFSIFKGKLKNASAANIKNFINVFHWNNLLKSDE